MPSHSASEAPAAVNIAMCPEHGLHGSRTECFVCGGDVEQIGYVEAGRAVAVAEQRDRLQRAYDRLAETLTHVINRVSSERRDDEHGLIFSTGQAALRWAEYEIDGTAQERVQAATNDLLALMLQQHCSFCDAAPGQPCRTARLGTADRGRKRPPHDARQRAAITAKYSKEVAGAR